jgi:hypothetical protein
VALGGDVIARSVSLTTFDDVTYLMVALGDGFLINYTYDLVHFGIRLFLGVLFC